MIKPACFHLFYIQFELLSLENYSSCRNVSERLDGIQTNQRAELNVFSFLFTYMIFLKMHSIFQNSIESIYLSCKPIIPSFTA